MKRLAALLFILVPIACLAGYVSSAGALVSGIALALTVGNPWGEHTRKWTQRLLALSVVGLGAGMNLAVVARAGVSGLGYTVAGLSIAMGLGWVLGRQLRVARDTSLLVSVGTAICGGSAIAAVTSVIKPKSHETSVALAIVFLLNALALVVFPIIGHHLQLEETQFGLWSALAIHDTSSVVGATLAYGPRALEVGTTVKLARALWIVPVALGIGWWRGRAGGTASGKFKFPWFILGFLVVAALVTYVPGLREPGAVLEMVAKRTLVLTLFLIGANLTRSALASVGPRAFLQGALLWLLMATGSLAMVYAGWVTLG